VGHRSPQKKSPPGILADAAAAYAFAIARYSAEQIVLWGESLGSAVAIALAADKPVGRLCVLSGAPADQPLHPPFNLESFTSHASQFAARSPTDSVPSDKMLPAPAPSCHNYRAEVTGNWRW
jgi:pimeloyl-ACP methyl ester carboxylesterase